MMQGLKGRYTLQWIECQHFLERHRHKKGNPLHTSHRNLYAHVHPPLQLRSKSLLSQEPLNASKPKTGAMELAPICRSQILEIPGVPLKLELATEKYCSRYSMINVEFTRYIIQMPAVVATSSMTGGKLTRSWLANTESLALTASSLPKTNAKKVGCKEPMT